MPAMFELKKTKDGRAMFNLRAPNHEIILTSETYATATSAKRGIESVRKNAADDARYERKTSGEQHFFVLQAANRKTIGVSERYATAAAMEKGIASVKKNAAGAEVKEV